MAALKAALESLTLTALEDVLKQQAAGTARTCVLIGDVNQARVAVAPVALAQSLTTLLTAPLQSAFSLWEPEALENLAKDYLVPWLKEKHLVLEQVEQMPTQDGVVYLMWDETPLPPLLALDVKPYADRLGAGLAHVATLDEGHVDLGFNLEHHVGTVKQDADKLNQQLAGLFPRA